MNLKKTIILISALLLAPAFLMAADEAEKEAAKPEATEYKNQTHCPVMGGKIDSTVYTDIMGHRVYHCCPMCTKNLKAEPEKFFEKAAADGIMYENIQTTCPVSGMELKEKNIFTDYMARRIYTCTDGCMEKVKNEPLKFLGLLDKSDEDTKKEKKTIKETTGHEGHGH